jgi:S-adenosylmethionine:tRNA ribosyltransferase-isomerase
MERLSDYDYVLPEDRIAQTPLEDRAASRLLALDKLTGEIRHLTFRQAPQLLQPGDLLVVNRTRVTAARLLGRRLSQSTGEPGGQAELLLLKRLPIELHGEGCYEALTKPAKRLQVGTRVVFGSPATLEATVLELGSDGKRIVRLSPESEIKAHALAPLPPYIHQPLHDRERYQTVYAKSEADSGSAAAPTAGLHFTQEILASLQRQGVELAEVELSIGLDTFRPVQSENLEDHVMHGEWCHLPIETADKIRRCSGSIVAVGTTTARTLETFARFDAITAQNRGQDFTFEPNPSQFVQNRLRHRDLAPGSLQSKLFLRPGNPFLLVDALFTNFHMPRTSMLMMLSAMAGREHVLAAYQEALKEGYRFLSFGDSMFIGNLMPPHS